jgi:serine/threonine protein kinase, bacterial
VEGWGAVDGLLTDRVMMDVGPVSMSAGPDGSLYVTDGSVIARLTPDGIWHVILGLNASSPPVLQPDGTPAVQSFTSWGGGSILAVGPDSSVYFTASWPWNAPNANGTNYTMVRKIAPDGRLYTVFGGGGVSNNDRSPTWTGKMGFSSRIQAWDLTLGSATRPCNRS